MTALEIFGIICLVLVCLGGAITATIDMFQKPKPTGIGKDGKRTLKIDRISPWEYLIIILPGALLLIGLFTNNREEKLTSFAILGVGLACLILSPYNNRFSIPWVYKTVFVMSLIPAVIAYLLSLTESNYEFQSGVSALTIMWLPILLYTYLVAARKIIKVATKTYPLTLGESPRSGRGRISKRLNRKANYWDSIWTLWNIAGLPAIIFYFLMIRT
ncbi:MAG: hypothetical protein J7599_08535 [Niabella sp.]|nr:hypothetical protein [Niabella sp.]